MIIWWSLEHIHIPRPPSRHLDASNQYCHHWVVQCRSSGLIPGQPVQRRSPRRGSSRRPRSRPCCPAAPSSSGRTSPSRSWSQTGRWSRWLSTLFLWNWFFSNFLWNERICLPVEIHSSMEGAKKYFFKRWRQPSTVTDICKKSSLSKIVHLSIRHGHSVSKVWRWYYFKMKLTGHLVNKADVLRHGGNHVGQRVLLHLDRGVGHEDQGVNCCLIRRQHVVYLWVHPWNVIIVTTHRCIPSIAKRVC